MSFQRAERQIRSMRKGLKNLKTTQDRTESFLHYRDDPVGFVQNVLGGESATRRSTGDAYQYQILEDLAVHPRVAIRSGHGVGKSTLDAWAAIHFLLTRPFSRVIIVAPEFSRQVRAVLFGEIRKWVRQAKEQLPLQVLSNRALVGDFGEEWSAIGLPATEPHRIEGFHAEAGVLLILDETKGVPNDVYDALMGALTGRGENRLLVTSTPGAPTGIFHRIFTKGRDDWCLHHIPSDDSSLVSTGWIKQRTKEWGEASPLYVARVLGEFPHDEEGVLNRLRDLEAAVDRKLTTESDEEPGVVLGVDPAWFGPDRTALAIWRGNTLETVEARQGVDLMETASWVASYINRFEAQRVRIDSVGIGAGVYSRLRQLGYRVEEVHASRASSDPRTYLNLRAELFWKFREALERGEISLPDNETLLAELSAIRYGYASQGQIQIEKKEMAKKRLGRSPDLADAAVLGFAGAAPSVGRFALIGGKKVDLKEMKIIGDSPVFWGSHN